MRRMDWSAGVRLVVMVVLGGIGAAAGFKHTHDWAEMHGQHGWLAWADAVIIECLAVAASFEVRRDHVAGRSGRAVAFPWFVLVAAFVVQMTSQVALAEKSPEGWLLAAMPALGFLAVVKLAMRRSPAPECTSDTRAVVVDRTVSTETTSVSLLESIQRPPPVTLTRLPVAVRATVIDTVQQAHKAGRPVTAEDIRRTIALPDQLLTELVTELNTTTNHHPVTG